jgi:molybdopterin/thiamine biosynthesis adenylyltransferase
VLEDRLDRLRVTVVGAGSVGGRIALHFARQQISRLNIVDRGRFKPESLLTQPIGPEAISLSKASQLGRRCKAISPQTRVGVFDGPVEDLGTLAFAATDLVLLATDNLAAEVEVGQRCLHHRTQLIHAAVHGETLVAQVRTFGNTIGEGPCPACGFGADEWAHLNQETSFSCEGLATGSTVARKHATQPTVSTSFLCSLAADLAVTQAFRLILDLGQPVADRLLEFCGFTHRTLVTPLARNLECPCEHLGWVTRWAPRTLAECTLRELAACAFPGTDDPAGLSFLVDDDLVFASSAACCRVEPCNRFVPAGGSLGTCGCCAREQFAGSFHSHRPVAAVTAAAVLGRPLGEIGAGAASWVVVRNEKVGVLLRKRELEAPR